MTEDEKKVRKREQRRAAWRRWYMRDKAKERSTSEEEERRTRKREQHRRWAARNREKICAQSRKRYAADLEASRERARIKARRYYWAHRENVIERGKQWMKEHPEKAREMKRKTRMKHREKIKLYSQRYSRKSMYGLTEEQFDEMLAVQGGCCAICFSKFVTTTRNGLHVDHDHTTRKVRGLLCGRCNVAIGMLNDDPRRARQAAEYLERRAEPATVEWSL